jgi:hypothetical protein
LPVAKAKAPEGQQAAAAVIEGLPEVDRMDGGQGPRKALGLRLPDDERSDAVPVPVGLKGVEELVLDPLRENGARRQDQQEPVATCQGRADLVVPLLRAAAVLHGGQGSPDRPPGE